MPTIETLERRALRAAITARDAGGAGKPGPILSGYAAKFDVPSQDLGGYVEVLRRGTFARSLAAGGQRAFWNHRYDQPLGRASAGTLRLLEDEVGLRFELDVPDTSLGRDVYELVRRGDVDGVSFGFHALADEWSADGKVNTVTEADLIEISPVVFPAYPDTLVEARSAERLARRPRRGFPPRFPRLERARRIILADED